MGKYSSDTLTCERYQPKGLCSSMYVLYQYIKTSPQTLADLVSLDHMDAINTILISYEQQL